MANIIFIENGSQSTGGVELYTSITGSVATDTSVKRTGGRSIKATCDVNGNPSYATAAGILADTGRRISVYRYFDNLPDNGVDATTGRAIFNVYQSNGTSQVFGVFMRSTGILTVAPTGGSASFVAGTHSLVTVSWDRISFSYVITSVSNWTVKVYVDGILDITASNSNFNLTNASSSLLRIGFAHGVAAGMANKVCHFSDVYVDDGTDLDDPGNIGVTAKRPSANCINKFNTAIGANPTNRWTNVNEVPISTTNGWSESGATQVKECYGVERPSVGDVDLTDAKIISRTAWMLAKGAAGGSGTPGIIDDNVVTGVTLTNAAKLFTTSTDAASYPATIGMQSTGSADDSFLYDCGEVISYIPGALPTPRDAVLLRG